MFEFVRSYPETSTTPARYSVAASTTGYDALVLRNHTDATDDDRPRFDGSSLSPATADELGSEAPTDIYSGVEIRVGAGEVDRLHGLVGKHSGSGKVVCVHGGDEAINRAAVSSERVDVLCHPTRGDDVFNHVLAREASENDVAVEFNLSRILRSSGGERVSALGSTRELLKLVRKYSTPFVISGDPSSHLELRAPRDVGALCRVVGFEESEVEEGMERTPSRIVSDDDSDDSVKVVDSETEVSETE